MIHVEQHGPVLSIRMARAFLGRPLWWSAAFWVDGLLVDAGPPDTASALVRVLRHLQVEQIVITHGHEERIGGLPTLRSYFPAARIYASVRTLPYLEEPARLKSPLYRRILWGLPTPFSDVLTLDAAGNVIETPNYSFRVVETPGHTRDHIALFEPKQRWVFCGDAFHFGRDRAWSAEADLFAVVSTLRTLDSLHPERLFTGTGRVSRTPRPELHEKIGQLLQLAREVARLDAAGLNVSEIVARIFQGEAGANFWTLGQLSTANLVEACRSFNAIFAPSVGGPYADLSSSATDDTEVDASDSSPNLSTGWGDTIR